MTSVCIDSVSVSCCSESQWASAELVVLMIENRAVPALIQLRVHHQCIKYWSAGKHIMEKEKMSHQLIRGQVVSSPEIKGD